MELRAYTTDDAAATLRVFLAAVTETAAADYAPEQIAAWARVDRRDLAQWDARRHADGTIVAVIDDELAGFSDLSTDGFLDMMFVAPAFARRGVATALLNEVAARAVARGIRELSSEVSVTARPFFEKHGFSVVAEQHPVIDGVALTNYRMTRPTTWPPAPEAPSAVPPARNAVPPAPN